MPCFTLARRKWTVQHGIRAGIVFSQILSNGPAAQATDYHRKAPPRKELEEIFRLETERTLSNDWVVRYFQLPRQSGHYAVAKSKVTVCEWEDGRIAIEYRE